MEYKRIQHISIQYIHQKMQMQQTSTIKTKTLKEIAALLAFLEKKDMKHDNVIATLKEFVENTPYTPSHWTVK